MPRPLLAAVFLLLTSAVCSASTPKNIVLIYADDVGFGDLGCYGAATIPTPNIDRLAANGVRFTSAYASSATCTPSRYSMLTGEYAWREPGRGIAPPNGPALIKPGTPTLATMLREAGYTTALVGKWHLGLGRPPKPKWSGKLAPGPLEAGFDEAFFLPTTNDRVPCVYVRDHHVVGLEPNDPLDVTRTNPDGQPTGESHPQMLKMMWSHGHNQSIVNGISRIGFMSGGKAALWTDETMADRFASEARQFLKAHTETRTFLFYSAHQTHVPRAPAERFVGATPHGARADAVVELDWCVGQLMDELKAAEQLDDTLIIFSSDNGPVLDDGYVDGAAEKLGSHRPSGPYRGGKYSRFEAGTRVPMLVSWPARVAPSVSEAIVSQVDLCRSLASLVGVSLKPDTAPDSLDMLPALLGKASAGRDWVVQHSGRRDQLAIRRGKWKFLPPTKGPAINKNTGTELGNAPAPQLFDLDADPGETNNLASQHEDICQELQSLLDSIR